MTLKDLNSIPALRRMIIRDEAKIAELRSKLQPGGGKITGMPHGTVHRNTIEELTPEIVEYDRHAKQCKIKLKAILHYIDSVPDAHIQLIMQYRFIDRMTWRMVAIRIGGYNTTESVKKSCYRYINKESQPKG